VKKKILIVLAIFIALVFVSLLFFTPIGKQDIPAPNDGDSEIGRNYVESLAKNISLENTPVYTKSFDEGCKTSSVGSGLEHKEDKRCTYRHISIYKSIGQSILDQLKTKIVSDSWTSQGQNAIMDTEYFRNNGASYYRYDGPLEKQAHLDVDYYKPEPPDHLNLDYDIANPDDIGKLEALSFVKSKFAESAQPLIVVDIDYSYFSEIY
jgi:hypothetical protein